MKRAPRDRRVQNGALFTTHDAHRNRNVDFARGGAQRAGRNPFGAGSWVGGGGLWVFTAMAAIFSARGIRNRSTKQGNAPAAAGILLVPIVLSNLDDTALGLFWTAFVLIAVLPFTLQLRYDTGGSQTQQQASRVSLWTIWEENNRKRLSSDVSDKSEMAEMMTKPDASFTRVYSANTDAPCMHD